MCWSPGGRLLVVAADGTCIVDAPEHRTAPMCPEPVGAAWLSDGRVAIADAFGGVVVSGSGSRDIVELAGVRLVDAHAGTVVVAGADQVWVVAGGPPLEVVGRIELGVGPVHALRAVTGALWSVGGSHGVALVDVRFEIVDTVVEVPGVLSLAASSDLLVAGDLGGSVHVIRIGYEDAARELAGYPDRVRHVDLDPHDSFIVAAADDELTWWAVDDGEPTDQPTCGKGHDLAITCMAVGCHSLVATGDADGAIGVWSAARVERPIVEFHLGGEVAVLAWSPDGRRLVAGGVDGRIASWRVAPGLVA